MRNLIKQSALAVLVLTAVSAAISSNADPIYRNSSNDLVARFNPGTLEIGDEVQLASSGYITNFSFEYWGTNTANPSAFAGAVQGRVRFYLNDGPLFNGYSSPGTMFFDSGWFSGFGPTPRLTEVFSTTIGDFAPGGLAIPGFATDITWSVQFQNMGATDSVGVDLYGPPTIGSSVPGTGFQQDYWLNNGSSWLLQTNVITPNFGATFDATVVPEPTALALSIAGGLGLLGLARKIRAKG